MKSIGEIKERFQAASAEELPELIEEYREDERGGVKKLLESAEKKLLALEKEKQRIEKLRVYEVLMKWEEVPWPDLLLPEL